MTQRRPGGEQVRRPARRRSHLPAGFIPVGPDTVASSRLQVYLPLQLLTEQQPGSWHLLRRPEQLKPKLRAREAAVIFGRIVRLGVRTVIFQKVCKGYAPRLMALLRLTGRRVVYVECDQRDELGFARHVDLIVAPAKRLADDLTARTGVPSVHIPDPLEFLRPEALQTSWQAKHSYRTLWVGDRKNWHQLLHLREQLRSHRFDAFQLVTISNHPDADIAWSEAAMHSELDKADLGILPITADPRSAMKSHNRATLFMGCGIPLIVSDSEVYRDVAIDGQTAFVYWSPEELAALPAKLADPDLVNRVRARAMKMAANYSREKIVPLWRNMIEGN